VNEKYLREYYIFNRFGMIITTNYRDALYLPDNDRRYFITFSDQAPEEFDPAFWKDFWAWYRNGGIEHVVAWLQQYDLSAFDRRQHRDGRRRSTTWSRLSAAKSMPNCSTQSLRSGTRRH
jgi:hypothetical protein